MIETAERERLIEIAAAAEAREAKLREALEHCASAAGNPDAVDACRVIIRITQAALEETPVTKPVDLDVRRPT